MKKFRLLSLAVLPLLLAGCNGGNQGGATEKEVDLSTEEGWNEVLPELKKAVKATAPAVTNSVNVDLSFKLPELGVHVTQTPANGEGQSTNVMEASATGVELSVKAGVKGLSTSEKFNDLLAYASISAKGAASASMGGKEVFNMSIADFGVDAYLKEGNVYADVSKVNVDDLNTILALLPDVDMIAMIKNLIPMYLPKIQAEGGKVYTDMVSGLVGDKFAPIKLVDGWEQEVDETFTFENISKALGDKMEDLKALKGAIKMGSDKDHKLIFTVDLDAKAMYASSKDSIYDAYVAVLPEGQTPISKTEFLAQTDKVMNGIKVAKAGLQIKFDNNYVLKSLSLGADFDGTITVENTEEGVVVSRNDIVITANPSIVLSVDTATDVASKLPSSFSEYQDIMDILAA